MTRAKVWVAGILSGIAVVAIVGATSVVSPFLPWVDQAGTSGTNVVQNVSQMLLTQYCPTRVGLSDQESYGDTAFAVNQGDLASARAAAAFGSVFSSSVTALGGETLSDLTKGPDSFSHFGDSADDPVLTSTSLVSAEKGTGSTGSVVSWASEGDLQGLSATSCLDSALTQTFLVPATQTGTALSLVVLNPSDKPTAVSVELWGTSGSGPLASTTDSSITVNAHDLQAVNLSAAAPSQEGVLVRVTSHVVPVFSTVTMTAASGLTSQGSDYVPAVAASDDPVLTGFTAGQSVTLRAFSETVQDLDFAWIDGDSAPSTTTASLTKNQVSSLDLGVVPEGVTGLLVTSQDAVSVSAEVTEASEENSSQADFAVITPTPALEVSAASLPDQVTGMVTISNPGSTSETMTLTGYDTAGSETGTSRVTVDAGAAREVSFVSIGTGTASVVVQQGTDSELRWAVAVTSEALDAASVSGFGVVNPTSLMPQQVTVSSKRSPLVTAR